MQVYLLTHTPNPDNLVIASAHLCYNNTPVSNLLSISPHNLNLIPQLYQSGHLSPFEHACFTFGIVGLSRVSTHQLVRHRLASYSQQSQRYVKQSSGENSVVIPPSIKDNALALKVYVEAVKTLQEAYSQLCELGIAREDARYILPNGQTSSLVMTMNARELHHFFRLRLCRRAQWEIRELARQMLKLCKSVAPKLFENAGPACITGKCEEARPCGKPYRDTEELLNA